MHLNYYIYLQRKLDSHAASPLSMLLPGLFRAFNAETLEKFWRIWNPFINYFLLFYVYKNLKKITPQSCARLLTFTFSGFFIHDLPLMIIFNLHYPVFTLWFSFIALFINCERVNCATQKWQMPYNIKNSIVLAGLLLLSILPYAIFRNMRA
jgi:hypothetical protein